VIAAGPAGPGRAARSASRRPSGPRAPRRPGRRTPPGHGLARSPGRQDALRRTARSKNWRNPAVAPGPSHRPAAAVPLPDGSPGFPRFARPHPTAGAGGARPVGRSGPRAPLPALRDVPASVLDFGGKGPAEKTPAKTMGPRAQVNVRLPAHLAARPDNAAAETLATSDRLFHPSAIGRRRAEQPAGGKFASRHATAAAAGRGGGGERGPTRSTGHRARGAGLAAARRDRRRAAERPGEPPAGRHRGGAGAASKSAR
jgi:hypothetical protein